MEAEILIALIALIGGFFFCRVAWVNSAHIPSFKRAVYVALFATVVIAFALSAYLHTGPLAVVSFFVGIVVLLTIVPLTMYFKVDLG